MPLRTLLRYLANNDRLVQKIAESYPVRRAAQICVSIYYRLQHGVGEKLPPIGNINKERLASFIKRLRENLSNEMNEAKKQIKDNEQKFKK